MPRQVDHQERRRHIAAAVARIAASRGLQGVSFREVASEAGVSVSLVQHYFGTKEGLLVGTLEIATGGMAERIGRRLAALGPAGGPRDRLRVVTGAFLPTDDESRSAMLLYHGFAAVALTDGSLRGAEAFGNAEALVAFLAGQLRLAADGGGDPDVDGRALLALVLGLSLGVLLEQTTVAQATAALDAHLARLLPDPPDSPEPNRPARPARPAGRVRGAGR